jgi:hypothetical protein
MAFSIRSFRAAIVLSKDARSAATFCIAVVAAARSACAAVKAASNPSGNAASAPFRFEIAVSEADRRLVVRSRAIVCAFTASAAFVRAVSSFVDESSRRVRKPASGSAPSASRSADNVSSGTSPSAVLHV